MPPSLVARIIEEAQRLWRWENNVEISLEANPTSIEMQAFKGFAAAGVNRVSMGVQALNDEDLRRLGRMHSVEEALRGLAIAKNVFRRVSIDLIYARQDQSTEAWKNELNRALGLGLDHLSLYQLTVEPGTVFAKRQANGKLPGLPDEDLAVDLWELTQDLCEDAGFEAYEVSNHAKDGARSRHNELYWTGADWAGVGPGAHGRLTLGGRRLATETALAPGAWLERAEELGTGETLRVALEPNEIIDERLIMGLRIQDGVSLQTLRELGWTPPKSALSELLELGYVSISADRLAATHSGRPVLNSIIRRLLT